MGRHQDRGDAGASEIDVEGVFVGVIAGEMEGGGPGPCRAGREGHGEGGASARGQGGAGEVADGEIRAVGAVLGEGKAGEIGDAGVSNRERDGSAAVAEFNVTEGDAGGTIR